MEDIHPILETILNTDLRSVLATITHVKGSAYRKEGASMLFLEDGSQIGVLSAGCLEASLSACVMDILDTGVSRSIVYDMQSSDPLSWGEEPGCGGVIHVTMEPVNLLLMDHLRTLKSYLDHRVDVLIVKRFDWTGAVSDYVFLTRDRSKFGEWKGQLPMVQGDILSSKGSWKSGMKFVTPLESDVFIHIYYPKPRLLLFGAGPDARPLAEFAAKAGFSVTISDWRPAYCDRRYFPNAERLLLGFPEETVEMIEFSPYDYVMIMTHHFRRDQQLVRLLSERKLPYLGILGSKSRTERLLKDWPVSTEVHSPAGLMIGAQGPEEIAISIVAEIISVYRYNKKQEEVGIF